MKSFNDQKRKDFPGFEKSRENVPVWEKSAFTATSRDGDDYRKETFLSNLLQLQYQSLPFKLEKWIISFSYQCTLSTTTTHGL